MKKLILLLLLIWQGAAYGALDQTSDDITDDAAGGASTAITFPVSPTTGCAVFVTWVGYNGSNYDAATVDDDQSGSYTIVKSPGTGSNSTVEMLAYLQSAGVGVTTVTITHTYSSGNYIRARAFSWCAQSAGMYDQLGQTIDTGTTSTVATTPATSQASELVVAVIAVPISSNNVHVGDPPASGYNSIFVEQDHATHVGGEAAYKVVSSIGAQSATWAHDSGDATATVATFKLGAPPAATVRGHRSVTIQ